MTQKETLFVKNKKAAPTKAKKSKLLMSLSLAGTAMIVVPGVTTGVMATATAIQSVTNDKVAITNRDEAQKAYDDAMEQGKKNITELNKQVTDALAITNEITNENKIDATIEVENITPIYETILESDTAEQVAQKVAKNLKALDKAFQDTEKLNQEQLEKIKDVQDKYDDDIKVWKAEFDRVTKENADKKAAYEKSLKEYNDTLDSVPDKDDGKDDTFTLDGGVSTVDGWKFMMTGDRNNVQNARTIVVAPKDMSNEEASHMYVQPGTQLRWNDNSQLVDVQPKGGISDYQDGKLLHNGGKVKLTNIGKLADGTNVNIIYENAEGDNNSWSISPKEWNQDNGNRVGKIIINSQDDLRIKWTFVDDNNQPLKIWVGNFFSDIDNGSEEPTVKKYLQNNDLYGVTTKGIAVVGNDVSVSGHNVVTADSNKGDNHDSNRNSIMTTTFSTGGEMRVHNAGSNVGSMGYAENDYRMITAMFGQNLDFKVATQPKEPKYEELPIQPSKPKLNVKNFEFDPLIPIPKETPKELPKTFAKRIDPVKKDNNNLGLTVASAVTGATLIGLSKYLDNRAKKKNRNNI